MSVTPDGLMRGMEVIDMRAQLSVPIEDEYLNMLGLLAVDNLGPDTPTKISYFIDLCLVLYT
jgi:hypothetical protein